MAKRVILPWMKRLHTYSGLLTFTAFMVWGLIGVAGAFAPGPGNYQPPDIAETREFPMAAPANLDDRDLARHVYQSLDIPLRGGHYNIRRDPDGNLAFHVFTANGRRDIAYLEDRGIARMDGRQNSIFGFLSTMHTAFSRARSLGDCRFTGPVGAVPCSDNARRVLHMNRSNAQRRSES